MGKIIDNLGFQGEERIQSEFLALGATTRSQKRHRSSDSDSGTADSIAATSNSHHYHVLKQSPGNLLIFFYPNWRGHCLNIINRILALRCFWTNYVSLIWLVTLSNLTLSPALYNTHCVKDYLMFANPDHIFGTCLVLLLPNNSSGQKWTKNSFSC